MKRIIVLFAAAVLLFGFSGQAMASFSYGDLIQVAYQTGATTGTEYFTDLGNITTLTSNTGANVVYGNSNLFGLGSLSGYNVAYFAITNNSTVVPVWLSGPTTGQTTKGYAASPISNLITVYGAAQVAAGPTATYTTVLQSNAASYSSVMNYGGATPGTMAGGLATGYSDASITTGYVDQYLYYYPTLPNNSRGTGVNGVMVADIRTNLDGSTVLNPSAAATPVPPSILLMGSGLLGMVGIRRKMIV